MIKPNLDDMKTVYYTILLLWSVESVTVYRSYFDDFNHSVLFGLFSIISDLSVVGRFETVLIVVLTDVLGCSPMRRCG